MLVLSRIVGYKSSVFHVVHVSKDKLTVEVIKRTVKMGCLGGISWDHESRCDRIAADKCKSERESGAYN